MSRSTHTTKDVLDSITAPTRATLLRVTTPCSVGLRHGISDGAGGLARSKTSWRHVATVLLSCIAATTVCAQNFAIDWHTIDSGGGMSTGGPFAVSGTVGQPDAGAMSGGNYSLAGGFWGIISAVQTPGGPLLSVRLTTTNTVVVSWPSPSTEFSLQQNGNLNTANWVAPPEAVTDNGTNKFIIVNPPIDNRFYRLFKP